MHLHYWLILKLKHNEELLKQYVARKVNIYELMGNDEDPFSMLNGRGPQTLDQLLAEAKSKSDVQLVENILLTRFLSAFWMADDEQALASSRQIISLPSYKMPKLHFVYFEVYRGIVLYRLHREGHDEDLLTQGNEVLSNVEQWRKTW